MDRYGKLFIKASVIYLGFGVLFGAHMSFADHGISELRFIHVHVMLLGFVAMMIFGVAYHILPRFNARPLLYPSWVPLHFWLSNAGLWGMCVMYGLGGFYTDGPPRMLFGVFGLMEGTGIFLFIINIFHVLSEEPETEAEPKRQSGGEQAPPEQGPEVKLSPKMKIAEILEKYPHLGKRLASEGFEELANPAAQNSIAKMVTLEMAAKKAGKELFPLLARLEGKQIVESAGETDDPATPANAVSPENDIKYGQMATAKTLIGPLLAQYPQTEPVFERHYGAACFTCPGQATETVEQTAGIHGVDSQKILDEINAIIETELENKPA